LPDRFHGVWWTLSEQSWSPSFYVSWILIRDMRGEKNEWHADSSQWDSKSPFLRKGRQYALHYYSDIRKQKQRNYAGFQSASPEKAPVSVRLFEKWKLKRFLSFLQNKVRDCCVISVSFFLLWKHDSQAIADRIMGKPLGPFSEFRQTNSTLTSQALSLGCSSEQSLPRTCVRSIGMGTV
jgi:hypothetical protein